MIRTLQLCHPWWKICHGHDCRVPNLIDPFIDLNLTRPACIGHGKGPGWELWAHEGNLHQCPRVSSKHLDTRCSSPGWLWSLLIFGLARQLGDAYYVIKNQSPFSQHNSTVFNLFDSKWRVRIEAAMIYTTANKNYHKESYHVRGGKKIIKETHLIFTKPISYWCWMMLVLFAFV